MMALRAMMAGLLLGACTTTKVYPTQPVIVVREVHIIVPQDNCGEVIDCWYEPQSDPYEGNAI